MPVDVIMPQMGESVSEGTILKWLIKEGDRVEKEQPIVEISTDKIDTEVPSPVNGEIKKILYPEGKTLPVRTIIAQIEAVEEDKEVRVSGKEIEVTKKTEEVMPQIVIEKIDEAEKRYSPLVRKLAEEYNIKLERVKGTGEGGRITKKDIMDYIASKSGITEIKTRQVESRVIEREVLIPTNKKRKITAERMVQSKKAAPHVTTVFEVDMTNVAQYREVNNDNLIKEGIHLTYLPFITIATVNALKEFPILNSSWTDDGIIQKNYINIGIAVSLEDGLIVPVIKDADKKDILQLAREIKDVAQRSRSKKLKPEDIQGGTFTITNYGLNGSLFGTPIIILPQVAILGVGAVVKRPVIINDAIASRLMVYLSLSFDHRVMDGTNADKFLRKIKDILESWETSVYEPKKSSPPTGYGGVW